MVDYSVEFWTLAADAKWNNEALQGVFVNGLNGQLKDELVNREIINYELNSYCLSPSVASMNWP